jgi:hypothetical protein
MEHADAVSKVLPLPLTLQTRMRPSRIRLMLPRWSITLFLGLAQSDCLFVMRLV